MMMMILCIIIEKIMRDKLEKIDNDYCYIAHVWSIVIRVEERKRNNTLRDDRHLFLNILIKFVALFGLG